MSSSGDEHYSDREDHTPVIRKNPRRRTNLYVKNFDDDMNEQQLCKLFATYGTITSCKVSKDGYNRPKGFGFVNFLTSSMAEDALKNLNGYLLKNGKILYVNYFQNKEDRREEQQQAYYKACEECNLFVSNLDESIDDRRLKHAFVKYGTITSVKVMVKDGRSKGYGFVCFSTADEASNAIDDMNGKELRSKPIYVALRKGQKERLQSSNYQYPQKTSDTQKFDSVGRQKNLADYSVTSSTSSSHRQTPLRTQFSTRLPSSVYVPVNDHHSQLDSRENSSPDNQYSSLDLSALKSRPPTHRNKNIVFNDDEEKD